MSERRLTAGQVAERLNARVEGDAERVLRGVATLALAQPDQLSWLGHAKYAAELAATRAGAVLLPSGSSAAPAGCVVLRVDDPDQARCEALRIFAPPEIRVPAGVHATAVVEASAQVEGACIGPRVFVGAGARIGAGAQLHAGVYVGPETSIGVDCVLWPNVVVRERVTIGARVVIHPNTTIGADGFGYLPRGGRLLKIPQVGTVCIEDDVEIGANSTIDRAQSGVTRIGRGTKIDNLVQVGHNCDVGELCLLVGQCGLSGSTVLGRGVVLAGQVGVADHLHIGDGAQVGAQSGVREDLPGGQRYLGTPARPWRETAQLFVALAKLPELAAQVRKLSQRVERLESTTDDSA